MPNETTAARLLAWRAAHPDYRRRMRERARARYATDPAYRERVLRHNRAWSKLHRATTRGGRARRRQEVSRGA